MPQPRLARLFVTAFSGPVVFALAVWAGALVGRPSVQPALTLAPAPPAVSEPAVEAENPNQPAFVARPAALQGGGSNPRPAFPAPPLIGAPAEAPNDAAQPLRPSPEPEPLPVRAELSQPRHAYQLMNNCGPVTAMMALSLFDINVSQAEAAAALKPGAFDRNVTSTELTNYIESFGVNAPVRIRGKLDLIKRLIVAGIPVIVHQRMTVNDDIGHYRLITAYDDATSTLTAADSYMGPRYSLDYASFKALWGAYHYEYVPLFSDDQSDVVRSILGESWDPDANWRMALNVAQSEVLDQPDDVYAWWRLGQAQHATGNSAAALESFVRSSELGLPLRHFWYQYSPFEVLFALGDYEELERWTNSVLAGYPGNPEVLVYKGKALEATGRADEAQVLYRRALAVDPQNLLATAALAA